jgi:hypothetical protein
MDPDLGRATFAEQVRTLGTASPEGRIPLLNGFTAYIDSTARFHDAITAVQVK